MGLAGFNFVRLLHNSALFWRRKRKYSVAGLPPAVLILIKLDSRLRGNDGFHLAPHLPVKCLPLQN
jgi:hypothetical protein